MRDLIFFVCLFFRNELVRTRQLTVTKLFNLLKLSTDDTAKYVRVWRPQFLFNLLFFNNQLTSLILKRPRSASVWISLVGRVLACRAGGRGFDSRGQTNTQGPKITEKEGPTFFFSYYRYRDKPDLEAWGKGSNGGLTFYPFYKGAVTRFFHNSESTYKNCHQIESNIKVNAQRNKRTYK